MERNLGHAKFRGRDYFGLIDSVLRSCKLGAQKTHPMACSKMGELLQPSSRYSRWDATSLLKHTPEEGGLRWQPERLR